MKTLILCYLGLIFPGIALCQVPDFVSNAKSADSLRSNIPQSILNTYDFLLIFEKGGTWIRNDKVYGLAITKSKQWQIISYSRSIYKPVSKDSSIKYRKPIVIKKPIPESEAQKVLDRFSEQRFWTLNADSLSINCYKPTDGPEECIVISDGTSYKFDIRSNGKHRVVAGYSPYYFLKELPQVELRKNFIICIETFEKLIKKYRC